MSLDQDPEVNAIIDKMLKNNDLVAIPKDKENAPKSQKEEELLSEDSSISTLMEAKFFAGQNEDYVSKSEL